MDTKDLGRDRRRKILGPFWQETVEILKAKGMIDRNSEVGYMDPEETIGVLLKECDRAITVPRKYSANAPKPPRGKSVSRGRKAWIGVD